MTRILLKSRILTFLRPPQLLASFTALRLRPKVAEITKLITCFRVRTPSVGGVSNSSQACNIGLGVAQLIER
jgi:hypothetical protein